MRQRKSHDRSQSDRQKKTKNFFFVNKKEAKKTLLIRGVLAAPPMAQLNKSFLRAAARGELFSKSAAFLCFTSFHSMLQHSLTLNRPAVHWRYEIDFGG
jgi:hypothetical protein